MHVPKNEPLCIRCSLPHCFLRQLSQDTPQLRKDLWGGELWSDGYYFATVGERGDWETVKRYVANQGKTMKQPTQLVLWH